MTKFSKPPRCWAGNHKTRLEMHEVCNDCGHTRYLGATTFMTAWVMPAGVWACALLLLALVTL